MKIKILATIPSNGDIRPTSLVFKTLRKGFPTLPVEIYINGSATMYGNKDAEYLLIDTIHKLLPDGKNYSIIPVFKTTHWDWVQRIINCCNDEVVLLDTDMVFFDEVESSILAIRDCCAVCGEGIPPFHSTTTGYDIEAKVHTAFMYINPPKIRFAIERFYSKNGDNPALNNEGLDLVKPCVILGQAHGYRFQPIYYDTMQRVCALLGPQTFIWSQNVLDKYVHLHAGTWVANEAAKGDIFSSELLKQHEEIYNDITKATTLREQQTQFYKHHAIYTNDSNITRNN